MNIKVGEIKQGIVELDIYVSQPTVPKAKRITLDDVLGVLEEGTHKRLTEGMVVARGGDTCPIFGDEVPYKSVTVVCDIEDATEVQYWLEYIHGANSVSDAKLLGDGRIAMRSDYQCW